MELETEEYSRLLDDIFRKGSRTYYNSTRFFPPKVRRDVYALYAFVRKADNFVDSVPQEVEGFRRFRGDYEEGTLEDPVNRVFSSLVERKGINRDWVRAFLDAMEMDTKKRVYYTMEELLEYMYGSAEVVGLMMAKVLDLPEESFHYARLLGRSMQYLNFIRDVREDIQLGRQYLPLDRLREHGLEDLTEQSMRANLGKFSAFMREQVLQYLEWQSEAEKGYSFIPPVYLIPIKTASDMYKWTARRIYRDPSIVHRVKVKPTRTRILMKGIMNMVALKF